MGHVDIPGDSKSKPGLYRGYLKAQCDRNRAKGSGWRKVVVGEDRELMEGQIS